MKAFIKYIAVITNDKKIHSVKFSEGVNVVTGKSSTGKSAILEVFDYCFGSSDFVIPDGVITEKAIFYFSVMKIEESYLILGRGSNPKDCYLSISLDDNFIENIENFNIEYFKSLDKYPLKDFKKEINKNFGINIDDADVDLEDRKFRYNNAKKATPSYRNFTSFMLQHQNLIANKHALFYRFDEKEKKDQVIDQFKIFSSFVDAAYYPLKQKLSEYERDLKRLTITKENIIKYQNENKDKLNYLVEEYELITNKKLFNSTLDNVLLNSNESLEYLDNLINNPDKKIKTDDFSEDNISKRKSLQTAYNQKIAEIKKIQNVISEIEVSIIYAKEFSNQTSNISHINKANLESKECKFCGNENIKLINKQKKLTDAIEWFNTEIDKSNYTISSFESDKKEYEIKIEKLKKEAQRIKKEITSIDKVISSLEKNKSIEYQATKVIIKIEAFLETIKENNLSSITEQIKQKEIDITKTETELNDNYNVETKLNLAERQINQQMNLIGKKLEFEDIYKNNLNLKFDLRTFELYQQTTKKGNPDKKIYLRSMGSGANWLSSHVALFTSLLHYSCSLNKKSLIPTILFLDQPSQVYFPTEVDNKDEFDGKNLKKMLNEEKKYNEDIKAVTNLFDQLVKFCEDTLKETGINPQIIITDHADNLKLKNADFNKDLLRKRWRGKNDGFIQS